MRNLLLSKNTITTVIHQRGTIRILIMHFGTIHTYIRAIFMILIMIDIMLGRLTGDLDGMFPSPLAIDGEGLDGVAIIGVDMAMEVMATTILGTMTLGIMITIGVLHIMQIVEM